MSRKSSLILFCIVLLGLSCRKDFECHCAGTQLGSSSAGTLEIVSSSRSDALKACETYEGTFDDNPQRNCELK